MSLWNALRGRPVLAVAVGLAALWTSAGADGPPPGSLVIIDSAGKEHKIKGWKFALGTRRLTWLAAADKAPAPPDKKDDKAAPKGARVLPGPEALEFRDDKSTNWQEGVVTLVPIERLRAIDYEAEKQLVTIKVAISDKPEDDQALTGTTRFKGTNKITIEAEVDRGDMGIAEVKFLGGQPGGVKAIRFPAPKAAAAATGRSAAVTVTDKMGKNTQNAIDLQALYRMADGTERLLPTLMFKKTFKVELAKVLKITIQPGGKPDEAEWTLKLKDGEEQTLTLLKTIMIDDKPATLEGLLGKVPAGYKLFPPHAIAEIAFEAEK